MNEFLSGLFIFVINEGTDDDNQISVIPDFDGTLCDMSHEAGISL